MVPGCFTLQASIPAGPAFRNLPSWLLGVFEASFSILYIMYAAPRHSSLPTTLDTNSPFRYDFWLLVNKQDVLFPWRKQMNQPMSMVRAALAVWVMVFCLSTLAAAEGEGKDACSLLTKDEIQAAVGQSVSESTLNPNSGPAVGKPCQYVVGSTGAFSIFVKTVGPGETADKTITALNEMKIATAAVSGLGDSSFFSSPGYGMIQLNTFQGANYLIITLMVPDAAEAAQKSAAETLMRQALTRM
jgi:hypothetical protein